MREEKFGYGKEERWKKMNGVGDACVSWLLWRLCNLFIFTERYFGRRDSVV
jgi:hypothetical protein